MRRRLADTDRSRWVGVTAIAAVLSSILPAAGAARSGDPSPAASLERRAVLDRIRVGNLRAHVMALSDDALEGRGAGYAGEAKAAEYVARAFHEARLEPAGNGGKGRHGYFQSFTFHPDGPVRPWEVLTSRNVVGFLRGADRNLADEVVLLGAHHDGQGRAGQAEAGRLPAEAGAADDPIWNSADDNASSVAVVIEIARVIGGLQLRPRRSIVFATFGAEEHGLNGSVHYVTHPAVRWRRHVAMVNLEKLGRVPDQQPVTASSGTSPVWSDLTERANRQTGMSVTSITPDIVSDTDHYPFAALGLPAIVIGTAHEEDTHRPSDSADKIAYEALGERARYVLAFLLELADTPERPRFAAPSRRDPGIIVVRPSPDEVRASGESGGVKVSAVIPGLPADRAGVRPGDLMVALDGETLAKDGNAREVLESAVAEVSGDSVAATIRRAGKRVDLVLNLRAR